MRWQYKHTSDNGEKKIRRTDNITPTISLYNYLIYNYGTYLRTGIILVNSRSTKKHRLSMIAKEDHVAILQSRECFQRWLSWTIQAPKTFVTQKHRLAINGHCHISPSTEDGLDKKQHSPGIPTTSEAWKQWATVAWLRDTGSCKHPKISPEPEKEIRDTTSDNAYKLLQLIVN